LKLAPQTRLKPSGTITRDEDRVEKNPEKTKIFNLTAQRRVNITLELTANVADPQEQ
jgi:hypothetical protein